MKKYFLLALFLPLLGAGGVSAQASKVKIESVGANYAAATPTVTFSVSWPAGSRNANEQSKLWVWVDYRPMKNNAAAGSWQRAGITETPTYHSAGTPALEPGNDSGFWLQGSTDNSAFAATLTVRVNVDLSGYDPQFNWCAYASDRPPHAEPIEGGYTLNGTPPFIIQTQRNNSGSTASISSSTYHNCIYGLTDATGAPGVVSPVPEITAFTSSAATLCAGQSATLTATLAAAGSFSYSFDNGATWQTGNTKVVSPATSATYILKAKHADGGCTVTALSPIEITVHPTPDVAFDSNTPTGLCANTSATLTVNDLNSVASSYCFTYQCSGCVHNPYTCGNDSTAAAGCEWWSECVYDAANTYNLTTYNSGTITVWAKAVTAFGCVDSISTAIPVGSGVPYTDCSEWTCGTQVWSGYLKNPVGSEPGDTKGYFAIPGYEYTAFVYAALLQYHDILCPDQWRIPSITDAASLRNCVSARWGHDNLALLWEPVPSQRGTDMPTTIRHAIAISHNNYMEQLVLEGMWIETTAGFDLYPVRCVRDVQ